MTDLLVPDVNNARTVTDWRLLRAFSPVLIAKMTEGTGYLAPTFARHRQGAHDHGFAGFGAYHFWTPGADPVAQARNAVRALGSLRSAPVEWLALDVEQGTDWLAYEMFCRHADAALGRTTWVYGGSQLAGHMPGRPRWVARYYDHTPDAAHAPRIGEVLWQFTDRYPVPGVSGRADCSVHRGSTATLLAVVRPTPPAPAPAPVPTPKPPAPAPAEDEDDDMHLLVQAIGHSNRYVVRADHTKKRRISQAIYDLLAAAPPGAYVEVPLPLAYLETIPDAKVVTLS